MSRHGHASGRISSRETFNVFARERHTLMLPERVPFSIPETVIFEISILDASSAWVRPRYRRHTLSGLSPAMSLSTTDAGIYSSPRSEEHTSELQSLMRISYAVFCLKKKKQKYNNTTT